MQRSRATVQTCSCRSRQETSLLTLDISHWWNQTNNILATITGHINQNIMRPVLSPRSKMNKIVRSWKRSLIKNTENAGYDSRFCLEEDWVNCLGGLFRIIWCICNDATHGGMLLEDRWIGWLVSNYSGGLLQSEGLSLLWLEGCYVLYGSRIGRGREYHLIQGTLSIFWNSLVRTEVRAMGR